MPKSTDVFVVGSINQDFVLKVERRPEPGETVTDADLSTHNGGKGANQAAAAALLGASVSFLGRVGDDEFGEPLVRALEEKGIDTTLIERAAGRQTGAAFITVTPDGENAITVAPGANRAIMLEDVDGASGAIRESRVLVAQMEVPKEVVGRAAEVAAGAVVTDSSSATHLPAPEVGVVDTTGAGDAFVGALAVKLARGASLEEAASYAVRAGAAAVTKEGAQGALPTPEVVETI